jgi:hypothetical protein
MCVYISIQLCIHFQYLTTLYHPNVSSLVYLLSCTRHESLKTCHQSLSTCHQSLSTCHQSLSTCHQSLSTCHQSLSTCHQSLSTCHQSLSARHMPATHVCFCTTHMPLPNVYWRPTCASAQHTRLPHACACITGAQVQMCTCTSIYKRCASSSFDEGTHQATHMKMCIPIRSSVYI